MTDFQITEPGEYASFTDLRWIVTGRCGRWWVAHLKGNEDAVAFFRPDGTADGLRGPLTRRILPEKTVWVVIYEDECDQIRSDVCFSKARANGLKNCAGYICTREITIPDGGGE